MSSAETHEIAIEPRQMALLWWSLGGFVLLLTLSGLLLWWRFGSVIFVDLLTTLQGCF